MPERQDGMSPGHFRAGKAHHLFDLVPHVGLVAVDLAFETGGLFFPVGALVNPPADVLQQQGAFSAEPSAPVVMFAVHLDHHAGGLDFDKLFFSHGHTK